MPAPLLRSRRRLATAVLLLAVSGLAAACTSASDGGKEAKAKIDEPATVVATTVAPTTTKAATVTTTTLAAVGLDTPEAAAQRLYDAWKAGDRNGASTVAEPDAVNGIWATAPGDYAVYNSCDSAEFDTSGCLFRGNSGTIQFTMEKRPDKATGTVKWVVIEALFADP